VASFLVKNNFRGQLKWKSPANCCVGIHEHVLRCQIKARTQCAVEGEEEREREIPRPFVYFLKRAFCRNWVCVTCTNKQALGSGRQAASAIN
jgi:hypothetical protein